ncbi:MAG: hypothetical protein ACR2MS_07030 [Weeksellaceae bacterium]
MKKIVLLSGLLLSSLVLNANEIEVKTNSDEDLIAKKEAIAFNTQKFKVQILKMQLKRTDSMDQSIRLLKELQVTVEKMEKRLK